MRIHIVTHRDYVDCVGVGRILSTARKALLEDLIRCHPLDHAEVPFTLKELTQECTIFVRNVDEAGYL